MNERISISKKNEEFPTLFEWLSEHHSDEEIREVFLYMDMALKYIHEHNYCIEVFYPSHIHVLNGDPHYIRFDNLIKLSDDQAERRSMIREDLFNSTLIQVGIYTNTLKNLTPEVLKDYFDDLSKFVPDGDVPYYRGIVQRGASVYFSEYASEKSYRDLVQLEKQVSESEGKKEALDFNLQKTNLSNDAINETIYRKISVRKEAAFVISASLIVLVFLTIVFMTMIGWIIVYTR